MKIPLALTLAVLVIVAFLFCDLSRQNDAASYGQPAFGYPAYVLGKSQQVAAILAYWERKPERLHAIRQLVYISYALLLVSSIYLCLVIFYHKKKQLGRRGLKNWLGVAVWLILAAAVVGIVREYLAYHSLSTAVSAHGLAYLTYARWGLLLLAIVPLVIALLPVDLFSKIFVRRLTRFLSQLLKSTWLFFPGILFVIFPVFCFWELKQGKDIIVAFIDNQPYGTSAAGFNYFRLIFFLAIGFWVYVSWYSSRIIGYIKKKQQLDIQQQSGINPKEAEEAFERGGPQFEISKPFLEEFPRVIGNSCFLVLELAVLQSPVLYTSISLTEAWIFFVITLVILWHVNRWINRRQADAVSMQPLTSPAERPVFRRLFWIILSLFIILALANAVFAFEAAGIWGLFILLLVFHFVFVLYINLRRVDMEKQAAIVKAVTQQESKQRRSLLKLSMDYFCIPRKEIGYYGWFLRICIAGILFYIMAIWWLGFARALGPFPFIILAFGVLLSFGNIVTAFSIRYKVNFHFILFLLALVFGLKETHEVRTMALHDSTNQYSARPNLKTYLTSWLANKQLGSDSCYDVYFVMSNGGASRSGYWTAAVLGKIEDSSLVRNPRDRFSDHIFCLSGTSGGGVGVATFFSLLRNRQAQTKPWYAASAQAFLKQDYFTYTFARMLGPDFFNYIFHFSAAQDRGAALESSFEISSMEKNDSTYEVPFSDPFSAFPAVKAGGAILPILFVNTTRMQDGNPGVVTNLDISSDKAMFNGRVDVVKLLPANADISITSGAILGARFPYLSPAGRIANDYFVDGGYFDNSGAGVVQELIRGILTIAREDASGKLREQIRRLNFKVLHIVNSPVGFESAGMSSVAPVKNDLMSPLLTIAGAYDKQTTVNDGRLTNYIADVNKYEANRASYTQISLYNSQKEWWYNPLNKRFRGEPPYSMNWFMSDTTRRRIDQRLGNNRVLDSLIKDFDQVVLIK